MMNRKPKTLLINPPGTGALETLLEMVTEPLGIAYIAGVLEREGYPVEILDALAVAPYQRQKLADGRYRVGLTEEQIADRIQELAPDIVGIACMFSAYAPDSHRIARCIKQVCPDVITVFGGAHTSVAPDMVLSDSNVDLAVVGEGEMTFLEIVKRIEAGTDYTRVKGVLARDENGIIIHNEPRELIKDLDELPLPARHLLPMQAYIDF